jgi:hypothetical protein
VRAAHLAARIDPAQVHDLGSLACERGGLAAELVGVAVARHQLACHADQRFLVLDQAQPDLLLRDFGVALDRLGLPLDFLIAQVPEGGNDRRQEQQHRQQRAQRRIAILPSRRLAPPPAAEQAFGSGQGGRDRSAGRCVRS